MPRTTTAGYSFELVTIDGERRARITGPHGTDTYTLDRLEHMAHFPIKPASTCAWDAVIADAARALADD